VLHPLPRSIERGIGRRPDLPFSANFDTKLWFDPCLMQKSVRLDIESAERNAPWWLGYPLVERLRFDLRPFSDQLEQSGRRALAYGWSSEASGLPLAGAAKIALDEYLLTLLTASSSAQLQR